MVDPKESSERARARSPRWLIALALASLTASPAIVLARGRALRASGATVRATSTAGARVSRQAPRVTVVSVGWTHGTNDRALIVDALSRAIAHEPNLRFQPTGGAVVLNTHVRALTIQRDGADALARCELSLVVTDGRGAVQGMLETRRVVRSAATEDVAAQAALREAIAGAVRRLASAL